MAQETAEVRGLMIQLQDISLALPNSLVVQILTGADIQSLQDAPEWLLGTTMWQSRLIPVISFEHAVGRQYNPLPHPRLLVLKSVRDIEKMPFYAIVISAIPHPVRFTEESLSTVDNPGVEPPAVVLNEVLVEGQPASIPNLDQLEEMLAGHYGLFAETAA